MSSTTPALRLLGFLFTMSDPTVNTRTSLRVLRQAHTDRVFNTVIPRNTDIRDAHFQKKDIFSFRPKAKSALRPILRLIEGTRVMKKKLDTDQITNELKGQSLYFEDQSKRLSKKTDEQHANARTSERANARTGERTNARTSERTNARTERNANERTNGRTSERTNEYTEKRKAYHQAP